MAKNIAEHVAKEAIAYIDDREKLKRKIERLYDFIPYCAHCHEKYYDHTNRIDPTGECSCCDLYLHCQDEDCHGFYCSHCDSDVCYQCINQCWESKCYTKVCIKCSGYDICFACWQAELENAGCPNHPLQKVQLPNGYTVPICESDIPYLAEFDETPENMLEFYGILHKRAKNKK